MFFLLGLKVKFEEVFWLVLRGLSWVFRRGKVGSCLVVVGVGVVW